MNGMSVYVRGLIVVDASHICWIITPLSYSHDHITSSSVLLIGITSLCNVVEESVLFEYYCVDVL